MLVPFSSIEAPKRDRRNSRGYSHGPQPSGMLCRFTREDKGPGQSGSATQTRPDDMIFELPTGDLEREIAIQRSIACRADVGQEATACHYSAAKDDALAGKHQHNGSGKLAQIVANDLKARVISPPVINICAPSRKHSGAAREPFGTVAVKWTDASK